MDASQTTTPTDPDPALDLEDIPAGNHALEVAARRGFGPLSPAARRIWHGEAAPCVTCGQLVRRTADQCDHCSQDLRPEMIEKMRAHCGPWFVLEHLRPFPGVSLDRIIRQIRRGLITETSIVRGPATEFQWRFAVETPGLCRYFNRCWQCHHDVKPAEAYCPACLSGLAFEAQPPLALRERAGARAEAGAAVRAVPPPPSGEGRGEGRSNDRAGVRVEPSMVPMPHSARQVAAPPALSAELEKLATAVGKLETIPAAPDWDAPARIGPIRVAWLAVTFLLLAVVSLLFVVQSRTPGKPPSPAPSALAPAPSP